MTQGEAPKPKQQKNKKLMLVRFGKMGLLGWFEHTEPTIPKTRSRVIIKTQRGLEIGDIVGEFNYRGGQFRSTVEQVEEYYPNRGKDFPLTEGGTFVRFATDEDLNEEKHLEASAQEEALTCQKFIREMDLPMKVIDAEHLFGGERIVIYFSSNGRVDFRELVRRLAREYQTRIELRQIGSRDEARLISDFESCGQECCCRRFLKVLEPVNMRMAKLQKATLDPSKISGHCGRLKCCLRYEDETYKDLRNRLPKKNSWVRTPSGDGRVVDSQVLTQLVMVQLGDSTHEAFSLDQIERIDGPPREERIPEGQAPSESRVVKRSWPKKPEPESPRFFDLEEFDDQPPEDDEIKGIEPAYDSGPSVPEEDWEDEESAQEFFLVDEQEKPEPPSSPVQKTDPANEQRRSKRGKRRGGRRRRPGRGDNRTGGQAADNPGANG
ncbi:MAG: hypothetical protein JW828_01885 [Sedimentisphaerales bacterium]|nr:hypothetical protein [Sedimentisphaerales bacterium]